MLFVCQNNLYGEHTRNELATSAAKISDRAFGYQMPGVTVDGNDPLAMYEAAKKAVDRARSGAGPTLIEARTFRFFGHVFGDADTYMQEGEKESAMTRDPVPAFRGWLIANGHASEAELAASRPGSSARSTLPWSSPSRVRNPERRRAAARCVCPEVLA